MRYPGRETIFPTGIQLGKGNTTSDLQTLLTFTIVSNNESVLSTKTEQNSTAHLPNKGLPGKLLL